jgi:two-component system, cell cycle response regulator DivK
MTGTPIPPNTARTDLTAERALRVLIVDDNPLNVELAEYVLSAARFEVESVPDAAHVLKRLNGPPPDLVLLDIQLPGMDGLDLARRLRSDERWRDIALLAFTAFAMKGDEQRMREAGCDGYLAKPIDVSRFADQVREVWLRSRHRR